MNKKRFWAFLLLGCGLVYLTSCQSDTSVHPSGGQAPTTLPSHTEAETSGHSPASTHSTQAPLSKTDMKRKILSDYHISLEDLSRCYLNEPQDTEAEQLHILSKRLDVRFPTPLKNGAISKINAPACLRNCSMMRTDSVLYNRC